MTSGADDEMAGAAGATGPPKEGAAPAPSTSTWAERWRARKAVYLLLGLLLLVAWEAGATIYQRLTAPTDGDWQRAAERLGEQQRATGRPAAGDRAATADRSARDPVLFAPSWVAPLGRHHFGRFVDLELATLSDVDRFARVWEVSIRGAQHRWLAGRRPARTWAAGRVKLALYEQQRPVRILFDFYEQLAGARVDRVSAKGLVRCRRTVAAGAGKARAPRFACDPRLSWNWVGQHLAEVGHQPYRCIFAQPVDDHRMRISFAHVPLGDQLVLYTGIDDFENRKKKEGRAPVLLQVFVDDQAIGSIKHLNDWDWTRSEIDTRRLAGQRAQVRFEVTTPLAYARSFCFAGDTRARQEPQ